MPATVRDAVVKLITINFGEMNSSDRTSALVRGDSEAPLTELEQLSAVTGRAGQRSRPL